MKILIVDDNFVNRVLLKTFTERAGDRNHHIMEAENGEIAVDLVKKHNFDLIFMDMMMPIMNGAESTKIIKEEINKDIPIIVISACSYNDFHEEWKHGLYDGIYEKPITIELINDIFNKFN